MKKYFLYLGIFLVAVVLVRIFLVEMYVVRKNSMSNTLHSGDRVLVLKQFSDIERDRIVVFSYDGNTMIKRCVGLPGDTVQIIESRLYINNVRSHDPSKAILFTTGKAGESDIDPFISANYGTNWRLNSFGPYKVPYKGMKIVLNKDNMTLYRSAIEQDMTAGRRPATTLAAAADYTFTNDFYFLLGDNRPGSQDSRVYGPMVSKSIKGKVFFSF